MLRTCTVLAGLIATLVIGNTGAESKRRLHHTHQQIQAPSANSTQPSAPDQRGTDQIPLTVKILPGEGAKEKAEEEEHERDEKAGVDKKLADETQRLANETQALASYTGGLAIFTLFLFCAAVVQIGLFIWQLRLIRQTLDNANEAAKAARDGAKAAQESADVARSSSDAAIAFERPYVRISKIKTSIRGNVFNVINKKVFPKTKILREPSAICIIENYGKTPAFVDVTQAQLRFSTDDLQIILTIGKPIPVVTLKTGQSYPFNVPLGEPINQQRAEDIQAGAQYFWLHFNFIYRDVLGDIVGETRETPGKWKYSFDLDSFSMVTPYKKET